MISHVNQGENLNQLKSQYFEAQRNGDTATMDKVKNQAMKTINDQFNDIILYLEFF